MPGRVAQAEVFVSWRPGMVASQQLVKYDLAAGACLDAVLFHGPHAVQLVGCPR